MAMKDPMMMIAELRKMLPEEAMGPLDELVAIAGGEVPEEVVEEEEEMKLAPDEVPEEVFEEEEEMPPMPKMLRGAK